MDPQRWTQPSKKTPSMSRISNILLIIMFLISNREIIFPVMGEIEDVIFWIFWTAGGVWAIVFCFTGGGSGFCFSLSISLQKRHLIATALISSPQNGHFFVSSDILYTIFHFSFFGVQKKTYPCFTHIRGTPMPEYHAKTRERLYRQTYLDKRMVFLKFWRFLMYPSLEDS